MGIHYRSSTLSSTQQKGLQALLSRTKNVPQPGDRAPDGHCLRLPTRDETTLFQVFRDPRTHLLLFDGSVQTSSTYTHLLQLAQRIESLFKAEIQVHLVASSEKALAWQGSLLFDVDHRVHTHYGIRVPSLAFIRPDGYIGLLCPLAHEQELVEYLRRLYCFPRLGSTESREISAGEAKIS